MDLQKYREKMDDIKYRWQAGGILTLGEYKNAIDDLRREYLSEQLCPSCGAFGDSEHLSTCALDFGL